MDLNTLWFVILTVLFCGFFFLEGFDYGVGLLLPFIAKKDLERRLVINSIGPFWDMNEVWMITAGAALLASFPEAYASLTSGFYLIMILMIIGLVIRAVGFEYRSKRENPAWRNRWDWAIFLGSLIPAYTWGLMICNMMRGLAINSDKYYTGGLLPLLNPYALVGALVFLGLFLLHGASFLGIKLTGDLHKKAQKAARLSWPPVLLLTAGFLVWTYLGTDLLDNPGADGLIPAVVAGIGLAAYGYFMGRDRQGWAFISGGVVILSATVMVFLGLYPRILVSSLDPAYSLTVYNSAASQPTLRLVSIIFLIFLPLVMLYQGWTYWVFRQRLSPDSPDLHY